MKMASRMPEDEAELVLNLDGHVEPCCEMVNVNALKSQVCPYRRHHFGEDSRGR